jgi:hypothetical protein
MSASTDGFRVPTIRRRYVARARYLKNSPVFRDAVAAAASLWNADHPDYAIRVRRSPTDAMIGPPGDYVYPPRLEAAMSAANREHRVDDDVFTAETDWRSRVDSLCGESWPAADFPNWLPFSWMHPAAKFLSACIVCDPKYVETDLIRNINLAIGRHAYDPTWPLERPREVFLQTLYERALQRITEHAESGQPLSAETINHLADQGMSEAREAERLHRETIAPSGGQWAYVHIYPGMTGEDWDALKQHALIEARKGEVELKRRAARMLVDGISVREVAGALGLSRAHVAKLRVHPGRK